MRKKRYIEGDLKRETCEEVEALYYTHLEGLADEGNYWHDFSREDRLRALCLFRVAYQDGWILNEDELNVEGDFMEELEDRKRRAGDMEKDNAWEVKHIYGDDDHAEVEI